MNKLSFISSIPSNEDTTIYLYPTNSQKDLDFSNVELNIEFFDLTGQRKLTIPVNGDSDGVYFKLSQLSSLGQGTYAFYLDMRYSDHMEYYPSYTTKYITLTYDNGNLVFKSIFTPDYTSIVPPDTSDIEEKQILHVHDININDIIVNTVDSDQNADVYLDSNDILHFDIPQGATGKSLYDLAKDAGFTGSFQDYEKTFVGAPGPKGDRGYNLWYDIYDYGENKSGCYWSDLKGSAPDRGPEVGDIAITPKGNVVQITGVTIGGPQDTGGGTFSYGPYLVNLQVSGPQGPTGKPFSISEVFNSKAEMKGDGLSEGDYVIIASTTNDPDNGSLFVWDGKEFNFIDNISGPQGPQGKDGATGPQGIQGPQGDRGLSIWMSKYARGGNLNAQNWSDLNSTKIGFGPQVGDLVIQTDGMITAVTAVTVDNSSTTGGGTWSTGPSLGVMKGSTPVRGVDYWTTDDINSMHDYIDDQIINGKW